MTEYSFRLLTNGAVLKDNLLYYDGKEAARLGDIMIFDSDGQADIGSIKSETVKEGEEYLVTVCVNDDFMKSAAYPVYIDPSVIRIDTETINGVKTIQDAPVYSNNNNANGGNAYNLCGYCGSSLGCGRVLYKLPGLTTRSDYQSITASQINSVTLSVREASGKTGTAYVTSYPFREGWQESAVTSGNVNFNNYDTYIPYSSWQNSSSSPNWWTFDLTNTVKAWKNGSFDSGVNGIILVNTEEATTDIAYYRNFLATEYSSSTYRPYITFNFTPTVTLSATEITIPVGETYQLYATTNPSGVSYSWEHIQPDIASVSSTGLVTGLSAGTGHIVALPVGGSGVACVVNVIEIPEGTYFIKNKATNRYMDIDGPSMNAGTIIHQWDLHGYNQERWIFKYRSDGYYTIKSVYSNLYVGIENASSLSGAAVKQYAYSSSNDSLLWKVTKLSNGAYTLTPKSGESYNRVLSVYNSGDSNGTDLVQYTYTNDSNYKDEWLLIRMLPTSGYELDYNASLWSGVPSSNNNCYAYALNNQVMEPGSNTIWYKQQPGQYYNIHRGISESIPQGFHLPSIVIKNAVIADFNKYNSINGTSLIFTSIDRYDVCPSGTYKVALVVSGSDYHWYRQDSDGLWSHKRGLTAVKRTDESGDLIIDPMLAGRATYTDFVGYFAVTPWNNMYS